MQRLTDKTADYCRDKCGMAPTCKRLKEGDICQNARCYERLRRYEDTGLSPQQVKQMERMKRRASRKEGEAGAEKGGRKVDGLQKA